MNPREDCSIVGLEVMLPLTKDSRPLLGDAPNE